MQNKELQVFEVFLKAKRVIKVQAMDEEEAETIIMENIDEYDNLSDWDISVEEVYCE